MESERPDPDALLAQVKKGEKEAERGRLKVFLGACAGVGKTYAMLEAARLRRGEGGDVVVGLVETHGRHETEALLEGLELLPRKVCDHRGVRLCEFDLDAAVRRRPRLILVDELAHTNAPDSRHLKRWQDVKELLDSGIDVYTTLNIQHLDSFNDVVAQITGLVVRETVPDAFVEDAHSLELVDLPFEELLRRLQEGKVYLPEQAERAAQNFFRPGNLSALRELALRFTAEKVGKQVQEFRQTQPGTPTWATSERIMVLVGPSPSSARLIRHACRLAGALHCDWIALNVETPAQLRLSREEQDRAVTHLRLAAKLGAEAVTLSGIGMAETAVRFARERNVTHIIAGKSKHRSLHDVLLGSAVDQLARLGEGIDVIVTRGDFDDEAGVASATPQAFTVKDLIRYAASAAVVALCTCVCLPLSALVETTNIVMVYLLGVVALAARFGLGPAVLASVLSVLSFDFFFVLPKLSFAVADTQYVFTFLVMLLVAVVISTLTVRLRDAYEKAQLRERRTAYLHALSRKLATTRGQEAILHAATRHVAELFACETTALLPDPAGALQVVASHPSGALLDDKERSVAQWVYSLGQMAGKGTETIPSAERLYLPLLASHGALGVLGLKSGNPLGVMIPEQLQLLEALAQQTALALEVDRLTEEARRHQVLIETETLRNALLSSVSHDLRTPLAVITGAASSLLCVDHPLPEKSRQELLQTIHEEAERLSQQVNNLLEMTRLEAGTLRVRKELQPLEEVVGAACQRLERILKSRKLRIAISPDALWVSADGALLEKVFLNLIENAVKFSSQETQLEIEAVRRDTNIVVEVRDRGCGIKEGEKEAIFNKFYRGATHAKTPGVGLGLTICRGIVHAHGGRMWAENRSGGGAVFGFSLPFVEVMASAAIVETDRNEDDERGTHA